MDCFEERTFFAKFTYCQKSEKVIASDEKYCE